MGKSVLGLKKKIQKEKAKIKQKQMKKKVKAFQKDYKEVVEKHGIALVPVLQRTRDGILARLQPQDVSEQLEKEREKEEKKE